MEPTPAFDTIAEIAAADRDYKRLIGQAQHPFTDETDAKTYLDQLSRARKNWQNSIAAADKFRVEPKK